MKLETLCLGCMDSDEVDVNCPKCGRAAEWKPESALHLPPGIKLRDQYLIGRALGHGGFGITYLGWDTDLARKTAIKEYMPNGVAGRASGATAVTPFSANTQIEFEWGLEKFMDEARVLARFHNHPGIVSVITFFRANGTAYLVMEFLDGTTFEDFLKRRSGRITWETAMRVINPILDALSAVHAEGILHRDISPDNIYLTRTGQVKLIDFGAARNALGQKSRNLSIILKEGYAPEEQYRTSGMQGPWTDVYAVGATLYHALTGRIPPPALDRQAEATDGKDPLVPPTQMGVALSPEAEAALMKSLAIRAQDRFQSVQDFKLGLAGFVEPAPTRPIYPEDPRMAEITGLQPIPASGTPPPPPGYAMPTSGHPSYQPQPPSYQPPYPSGQPPYQTGLQQAFTPPISGGPIPPSGHRMGFQAPPATILPPPPQIIEVQRPFNWLWVAILVAVSAVGFAVYKNQGPGTDKTPIGDDQKQQNDKKGDNTSNDKKTGLPNQEQKQQPPVDNKQQQQQQQQQKPVDNTTQKQQPPDNRQQQQRPPVDNNQQQQQQRPVDNNQQRPPVDNQQQRPPVDNNQQSSPRTPSSDYMSLTTQAQQAMGQGNAQGSIQLLQQAIAMSPDTPRAYDMLGFSYLYLAGDPAQAEQAYRNSIRHGGGATFRLAHDHNGTFANYCNAVLQISVDKVTLTSQAHVFTIAKGEIREVKNNRMPGFIPGIRNNLALVNAKSFHIKAGNKTYNLAPTSRVKDQEREIIQRLLQ